MAITFLSTGVNPKLPPKTRLRQWINQVITAENKRTGQINFMLTTDAAVLEKNIAYLNHNTYTDIITFDYSEGATVHGDIIISTDRVAENAKKFKVEPGQELLRVMIHGVLHLCGYKDKLARDKALMRDREDKALKAFGKLS